MRRPAPLPVSPEQEEPRAGAARRTARTTGDDAVVTPIDTRAADGAADAETDAEHADPSLTQRDVWRAARARRKALKSEIRRFTQASRKRRLVWGSVLGALVLLVGGTALAAYSPLFAVEDITVAGATTLDAAEIEAALADQVGTPLAAVDGSEIKAALLAFPLIETYTLEAKPPHELVVRIVERTPVGVIETDAGYTVVDAAGVALSTTTEKPADQPVLEIEGGVGSDAFASAGLVVRSLPADLRAQLTRVQASSPDDVTLTLGDRIVVWGSEEESVQKAQVLEKLIAANPEARSFDVTSPRVGIAG